MTLSRKNILFKMLVRTTMTAMLFCAISAKADNLEPGFYLGADVGRSSYKQPGVNSGDPTFGLKAGYQFNSNFAAEVLVRSLSFRLDGLFADSAYYPESNRSFALLGSLPIANKVSIYARLGLGETTMHSARKAKHDYQKSEAMVSVGSAYDLTKSWRLHVEASRFDQSKIRLLTLGAQFYF